MEPYRMCIKKIIALRELEKLECETVTNEYGSSDCDTESTTSEGEGNELPTYGEYNAKSNYDMGTNHTCRDDKYFDAIKKVVDMSLKEDAYDSYGKYIAGELRHINQLDFRYADKIMIRLQEEMIRLKRECLRDLRHRELMQNRSEDRNVPEI